MPYVMITHPGLWMVRVEHQIAEAKRKVDAARFVRVADPLRAALRVHALVTGHHRSQEPEDGRLWVYGVGEDGVPAFTDYGIECLEQIIADERAAGRASPKIKSTK